MSFEVSPSALDSAADLVGRYAADADAMRAFVDQNAQMSDHELGFLGILATGHGSLRARFEGRIQTMSSCSSFAATELRDAAGWYRETDTTAAAELDAAYPPGERDRLSTEEGASLPDAVAAFADLAEPGAALLVDLTNTAAVAPEVGQLEQDIRKAFDTISPAYWIREVVKQIAGSDPLDWVVQWIAGDWQSWGRCTLVWSACSDSAHAMAENLRGLDEALAQTWSGNAADAAMGYFQKLTSATDNESVAFGCLAEKYRAQTAIVFHCVQIVNDLINMLIDYLVGWVLELGFAAASGGVTLEVAAPVIAFVMTIMDRIGQAVAGVLDLLRLFEVVAAAGDMPEIPDSQLDPLVTDRYDHPEC